MDDTLCAALRYLGIHHGEEAVYAELSALKASLAGRITPRSVWRACHLSAQPMSDVCASALGGKMLADCTQAVVLVCTLGAAFDLEVRRLSARDMRRAALLDALGSAWVESACDAAEDEIRARFPGMHLTDRFSPGYGDLPLTLQPALTDFAGARRIGVTLTDTLLLNPQKSVTAILGIADTPQPARVRGCVYCALRATCPYQKTGVFAMFDTKKLLFLDGAMGTLLQQGGLQPGSLPELVALRDPDLLTRIHRRYIDAGAQVVYANTFGANRRKLAAHGVTVDEVVSAAIAAAKSACAGTSARVALDIGPLGELLEPLGTLPFETAVDMFAELVRAGVKAGADCIAIETMTDLQEARAALIAAKEHSALPVLVTMSFDENGRTFTGCTAEAMAATLTGLGADAIGVNCSLGPGQLLPILRDICRNTPLPVVAKPNAGLPDPVDGHYDLSPAAFAEAMAEAVAAGVSVIGGCCGTDPAYIRALHERLHGTRPGSREVRRVSRVCTATKTVGIDGVRVIGERINPTGKKRFQQALLAEDLDYIVDVAIQQEDAGADILDVNVGHPGVDEVRMLPMVVRRLQEATALPLQLDSTDPAALEAALRVYCGKAAVNSVNGDASVLARVLPIVKKYGAAVVGLTLDENGLPTTVQQRVDIASRILHAAQAQGIPCEDVWIDCLTLTVSAQQAQAEATLEAVRRVTQELRLPTVLGISNISFGLPNRPLIAQAFLIRALSAGLTLPILNPNQRDMMDAIAACRVLNGEDAGCRDYVARFAESAAPALSAAPAAMTLTEAILRGLKGDAARLAREALTGQTGLDIVEGCLIPALDRVGADYETGKTFLPQLLSAAQAAQAVFSVLQAHMGDASAVQKEKVLIATVKGDIHDIGKNIVRTVMANYGYAMLDLGRDVPPERIVEAVRREGIRLVGLSALMTTTLPAMEETVRQLHALPEPPAVMLGGAVVTQAYAEHLRCHYAKDAKAAVEIARKVFEK